MSWETFVLSFQYWQRVPHGKRNVCAASGRLDQHWQRRPSPPPSPLRTANRTVHRRGDAVPKPGQDGAASARRRPRRGRRGWHGPAFARRRARQRRAVGSQGPVFHPPECHLPAGGTPLEGLAARGWGPDGFCDSQEPGCELETGGGGGRQRKSSEEQAAAWRTCAQAGTAHTPGTEDWPAARPRAGQRPAAGASALEEACPAGPSSKASPLRKETTTAYCVVTNREYTRVARPCARRAAVFLTQEKGVRGRGVRRCPWPCAVRGAHAPACRPPPLSSG